MGPLIGQQSVFIAITRIALKKNWATIVLEVYRIHTFPKFSIASIRKFQNKTI